MEKGQYFFDEDSDISENNDLNDNNIMHEYKGYFVENEEEEEKKFYEFGAHFPYKYLYNKLEILAKEREEQKKELENKLKEKDGNTNSSRNNFKNILSIFQQKGKSRNREDVNIGLTYMPQVNKNNTNNLNKNNPYENIVKSTSENKDDINNKNRVKSESINKSKKNKNRLNNNICVKGISRNKNKKKNNSKATNKVRKRNHFNSLYANNSINNNILSVNNFNRIKLFEKNNLKNITHDIQFTSKSKDNLVQKLQSILNSKEKLRKQILNPRRFENKSSNKINKIHNTNNIVNQFRQTNTNNTKNIYSKFFAKNISSPKGVMHNDKSNKEKISNNSCVSSMNKNEKKNNSINHKITRTRSNKSNIINSNIKSIKEYYFKNNNNNFIFNSQVNLDKQNYSKQNKRRNDKLEGSAKNKNNNRNNNAYNIPLFNQMQNKPNKIFNSINLLNNNNVIKNKNPRNKNLNNNINININILTHQIKNVYNPININFNRALMNKNQKPKNIKPKTANMKNKSILNKKDLTSMVGLKDKNLNIVNNVQGKKNINNSMNKNSMFAKGNFINGKNVSRNIKEQNNNTKPNARLNNTTLQNKKIHAKNNFNNNLTVNLCALKSSYNKGIDGGNNM